MAGLSDYAENKVLELITGKTGFSVSSPCYIALTTVAVTDSMTGSTITEANYTGYARKAVAGTDWTSASGGSISTANTLTFNNCTGGTSTVIGWAVLDSSTIGAGNVLFYGTCTSVTINSTQQPAQIAAGALTVTAD